MKAADYRDAQAAAMSEAELLETVRLFGRQLALLVYHTHDSRRSEAGFPDCIIVGRRGVLWRELKKESGRVTGAQQTWINRLTTAGQDVGVWRPSDLVAGRVLMELRALVSGISVELNGATP
jgi:hypothetical protein